MFFFLQIIYVQPNNKIKRNKKIILAIIVFFHTQDYKEKLKKVCAVRSEVKSHISNLPDLTQLPDVTGGLAPLPSAGDLFSMH